MKMTGFKLFYSERQVPRHLPFFRARGCSHIAFKGMLYSIYIMYITAAVDILNFLHKIHEPGQNSFRNRA